MNLAKAGWVRITKGIYMCSCSIGSWTCFATCHSQLVFFFFFLDKQVIYTIYVRITQAMSSGIIKSIQGSVNLLINESGGKFFFAILKFIGKIKAILYPLQLNKIDKTHSFRKFIFQQCHLGYILTIRPIGFANGLHMGVRKREKSTLS